MRCGQSSSGGLPPGCECIPPGELEGEILVWDGTSWVPSAPSPGLTPPTDPGQDGFVALGSGGDLTYLGGTVVGQLLTWNGTAWVATAAPRSAMYEFASGTMAAAPATSYLHPGNGATGSAVGPSIVGSFRAPFAGNLTLFDVNHRNPSLAVNITYELEFETLGVQAAATIVLNSGTATGAINAALVAIAAGQRFNVRAVLPAGAPVNARPVWTCMLFS
jgi:hypothetical protein